MGWKNIFQVEKDEWCRGVLAKHFPDTIRYSDIKEFRGEPYYESIDIISGGFPCQPFSVAELCSGAASVLLSKNPSKVEILRLLHET